MMEYILAKVKDLEADIKKIDNEHSDILKKAEKSILRINRCLKKLREFVRTNQFASLEEEIFFFKKAKPAVFSKLIYFVEIFNIEFKCPVGSDSVQRKYFLKELKKLDAFFFENQEFYRYYRSKATSLDTKYFVRGRLDPRLCIDTFIYDADPGFSTSHDYKLSRIMANDLLSIYLKAKLAAIDHKTDLHVKHPKRSKCSWTESKIALVELIYALQAAGCINNGRGDMKEIAVLFESMLNIDLGDFYRKYLEIKIRHNPTKFLDNLQVALQKKIEEQDE